MFRQRLVMTLLLIPMVVLSIYFLPSLYFSILVLLLVVMMNYEWQQFIDLSEYENSWLGLMLLLLGSLMVLKFCHFFMYLDILFWILAVIGIVCYPKFEKFWGHNAFICLNAWLLIGVLAGLLIELQEDAYGKHQLMSALLLVWAADIGAYLFGKKWGYHKMIPKVSPGKSWEGLFGGWALAMLVGLIEVLWMNPFSVSQWLGVVAVTVLASVFGDLWMSVLKRHSKLKDSGHLIPGHGGILDRLDSLLAALPVFYFCLNGFNGI